MIARASALAFAFCLAGCSTAAHESAGLTAPGARYVIGAPYQAGGEWQYPRAFPSYDRTGLATVISSGGPAVTADGAAFDQGGLTAQSPVLPLPSLVEVTDLVTGRRMTVLVNDRGPATAGRVLAVTRKLADLLGFPDDGVVEVRVRLLAARSAALQAKLGAGPDLTAAPVADVRSDALLPPPGARGTAGTTEAARPAAGPGGIQTLSTAPDGIVTRIAPAPGPLYVELDGFGSRADAFSMLNRLDGFAGGVVPEPGGGRRLYAVHLGPYHSVAAADAALQAVLARGIAGPEIVAG